MKCMHFNPAISGRIYSEVKLELGYKVRSVVREQGRTF